MNWVLGILVSILIISQSSGCRIDGENTIGNELARTNSLAPTATPTSSPAPHAGAEVNELCKRIGEIKKLPDRDPNDTDSIYEEVIARGNEAIPCLIEEIANETPMRDPRSAPIWQNYKVGDTAIFLLVEITGQDQLLEEMLPTKYRAEWKTNGIYAYFNYVLETKNRRQLQRWWRTWVKENVRS